MIFRGWLFLAVAAGIAVRVAVAPIRGQVPDLAAFATWGAYAADHSVATIWRDGSCDYMPIYPTILGLLTRAYRAIADAGASPLPTWALKIPPIAGDVVAAALIFAIGRRVAGERVATVAAAFHFLNPAVILESAVWGQVDVFHSLLVALSLVAAHAGATRRGAWHALAWSLLTLATLVKLQAIVFAPILVVTSVIGCRPREIVGSVLAAAAIVAVVLAPIALAGQFGEFWTAAVANAPTRYPRLTMHAYNAWWLVPSEIRRTAADTDPFVAGLSYRWVGLALFAIAGVFSWFVLWRAGRGRDPRMLFLVAAWVAVAFFMLPTEMHDRYLYPALPLLAAAAALAAPSGLTLYALFSLTLTANLTLSGVPLVPPWLVAAVNVAGFVALGVTLVRLERRSTSS